MPVVPRRPAPIEAQLAAITKRSCLQGQLLFCLHDDTQGALNRAAKTTISTGLRHRFHDGGGLNTDGAP
ncbi:hypothetical protein CTI10_023900 [Delftia acidovorans]|uniref:Uncharacterized protein n=1 Tax=Chryseobacterium sp. B5 TaxID=2050562 RepID=A0A2G7T876_9FLAO|nr:hypothetical protein CTI10_023900 [Delftia acidovorans]